MMYIVICKYVCTYVYRHIYIHMYIYRLNLLKLVGDKIHI